MFSQSVNKPIIITGCQRSGTTLLSLMLDSHPQICSLDEIDYDHTKLKEYLEHPAYHPCVALKLPTVACSFQSFGVLPDLKVLWCVRDPRDVVSSMINLKMESINGHAIAWANHSLCAMREIENCLPFIDGQRSFYGIREYERICRISCHLRNHKDAVLMGAICWEFKNELLDLYARENIQYMVVGYENLISDPKTIMANVLSFLELPWHNNVLHHHELHSRAYTGNTMGNRPIDPFNSGKWKHELSDDELDIIESLCAHSANKFGYQFSVKHHVAMQQSYDHSQCFSAGCERFKRLRAVRATVEAGAE